MTPFIVPLYLSPAAGSSDSQCHEMKGGAAISSISVYFRHEKDKVNVTLQLLKDGVATDITEAAIKGHNEAYTFPLGFICSPQTYIVATAENSDSVDHAVNVIVSGVR